MATVSVSVPEELKQRLDAREDVNWSAVARKSFEDKLRADEELAQFKEIVSKSKLTEKDALEIGREINKSMAEKFRKLVKQYESTGQLRPANR